MVAGHQTGGVPSTNEPPPIAVLEAFGVSGPVQRLDGGAGSSFAVGDAVLKPAGDDDEAGWVQELTAQLVPDGFRIAPPIRASDGSWTSDGWVASERIAGLRPAAPDWGAVIEAGHRFTRGADAVTSLDREFFGRRTHRWAVADRCAWGEEDLRVATDGQPLLDALRATFGPAATGRAVIHADLSGNVHLDPDGTLVVLDISPYLRPATWAEAIVLVDAVLWWDTPAPTLDPFAHRTGGVDLLARAAVFRLAAELLDPGSRPVLAPYERLTHLLTGR